MGRECNLELGLSPTSCMTTMPFTVDHNQQITVFCNGKLSFCDFTELQARAILWVGSQERNGNVTSWPNPEWFYFQMLVNGKTGFSVKKSLQRFLQTRKRRIQSNSPYHKLKL